MPRGQTVEERQGLVFERHGQDLSDDIILGLGTGGLTLTSSGANQETIQIPNGLLVNAR